MMESPKKREKPSEGFHNSLPSRAETRAPQASESKPKPNIDLSRERLPSIDRSAEQAKLAQQRNRTRA